MKNIAYETSGTTKRSVFKFRYVGLAITTVILIILTLWQCRVQQQQPERWDDSLQYRDEAASLQPSQLMSSTSKSPSTHGRVSKFIHQSWDSQNLPARMSRWSGSCRKMHSDWQWILWTDHDNYEMVKTYFSWFLDTFEALPSNVERANVSRYMYMYLFGGVFASSQTDCLRPLEELFNSHGVEMSFDNIGTMTTIISPRNDDFASVTNTAFFGRMDYDNTDDTLYYTIPNAWMAATPGHPFFLLLLIRLNKLLQGTKWQKQLNSASNIKASTTLYTALQEYNTFLEKDISVEDLLDGHVPYHLFNHKHDKNHIVMLPSKNIYPYAWNNAGRARRHRICRSDSRHFDSKKCKASVATAEAYAISYWGDVQHSDTSQDHDHDHPEQIVSNECVS